LNIHGIYFVHENTQIYEITGKLKER